MNNQCTVCKATIQVMCRKGTGICGEICEKRYKKIREDNFKTYEAEMNQTLLAASNG